MFYGNETKTSRISFERHNHKAGDVIRNLHSVDLSYLSTTVWTRAIDDVKNQEKE